MKILFFVSSMHAGGAERVAATLASAWAKRGDTVTLAPTYTGKGDCFYPLDPAVRLEWLADRMSAAGRKAWPPLSKLHAMRKLVRETQPDVIVSFLTNVNVMVLLATRGMGVPVVVCERTNPAFSSSAGKLLQFLRRKTYPWAAKVLMQSQDGVQALRRMVPNVDRLDVIPNPLPPGIDELTVGAPSGLIAAESVVDVEPVRRNDRKQLMAMGRLVPFKRFDALIQAFGALAADYPEWDLTIWGEGPLRSELEQQVHGTGLTARILLPGRTSQPWHELAKADIFALTSRVEGFPNVLLEAMALGCACVTVDCPSGPREMSQNGKDAILVPLEDHDALVSGLAQLMDDGALRSTLGRHAAVSVRERYGLRQILAQWDTLFASIVVPAKQDGQI
ncbi:glycosyltransferase family 4 protein [Pollutimonas harenae]|uniref:Glycosyltransferase family 4 protein n=1 Tax=Pollutimonas harenae TaxID=657015 RepID=A0A853H1R4_9BURK|nr:glycosyltransferase family 4 protein [Pollutimonas harenae]NYT86896.1 glycosyltransferase family 4 protein [Pollutimonas harenae]TEA69389.1 glycosyltransferase family 4 protein [Pollutimonas harenae]